MGWIRNLFFEAEDTATKDIVGERGADAFVSGINPFIGGTRRRLIAEYRELTYSCVSVIAEEIAKYEPYFYRKVKGEEQIDDRHPMLELLAHPNETMTTYELWEATQAYKELTGECFWFITLGQRNGLPMAIDLIRPDTVQIAIQDTVDVTGQRQIGDVIGYTITTNTGEQIPVEPNEMIHFKTFNPFNRYRGYSTVEAGLTSIGIDTATSEFQKNFMENNATPASIVSFKGNIKAEAFNKIKKIFTERHAGVDNAGKSLFIRDADIDIQKLGLSLADLDLTALKQLSSERVRGMFRVPKILLGHTDGGGLGRAAVETEEYVFQKYPIEAKKTQLDDTIMVACRTYWPRDQIFVGHESLVPEDKTTQLAEDMALVNTIKTVNEIRTDRGLDEIEGGDFLYTAFNMSPINPIEEDTPTPPPLPQDAATPQPALESGDQADPTEDPEEPLKAIRKRHNHDHQHTTKAKRHQNIVRLLDKIETEQAAKYRKVLLAGLEEQRRQVTETYDHLTAKAVSQVVIDDNTYSIVQKLFPILQETIAKGFDVGNLIMEMPDKQFLLDQARLDAIWNKEFDVLKGFNEQTQEQIRKQLAISVANGEEPAAASKRIAQVFDEAEGYRATRLSKTQQHSIANEGVAEAYRQEGYTHLIWTITDTACPICIPLEGSIVEIGEPFFPEGASLEMTNGGTFTNTFTDVKYGDMHPNCQCILLPADATDVGKAAIKIVEKTVEVETAETEQLRKALMEQTDYMKALEEIAGVSDGQPEEA